MTVTSLPERRLERARLRLSELVVSQAEACAVRVGFGWEPSPDAPDTFDKLRGEFSSSADTGRPLRVATVNVEPSIFTGPEINTAMRFWHDVTHIEENQHFDFDGEMAVAQIHLDALVASGEEEGSVAWQLLRADTVGQNMVFTMTGGGFVPDQLAFARSALRSGLPFAVLEAVEQIERRSVVGRDMDHLRVLLESTA